MNIKPKHAAPLANAVLGIALLLGAGHAAGAEYWLCARAGSVAMPDGLAVPIWGYVQDDNNDLTDGCPAAATPTLPGPALTVPAADATGLTVHLRNELPEPSSIVIPGQTAVMTPVWTDGATGVRTSLTQRVRSFTHEAAAGGGTADYAWGNLKPGTYLYHSGTHPQAQVQMGLYGAVVRNFLDFVPAVPEVPAVVDPNNGAIITPAIPMQPAVPGQAYEGVPYEAEVTLFFSEIDPVQHAAIAAGTFGTAAAPPSTCPDTDGTPMPLSSALCYKPAYFLINGEPHSATAPSPALPVPAGKKALVRVLNAGLRSYVPVVQGTHMTMIAEDGNRYQFRDGAGAHPRDQYQYSVLLAALKTVDAVVTPPAAGLYPVYDRRLHLTTGGMPDGGMLAYIEATSTGTAPVITSTPVTAATGGIAYAYQVAATDADPLDTLAYSLDLAPGGMAIDPATGLIGWTPARGQGGNQTVRVRVTDSGFAFATQQYTLVVTVPNTAPQITSAPVTAATEGSAYAYQVVATDAEGDALSYALTQAPAGMGIDPAMGLIGWTPAANQVGNQTVQVRVTDALGATATQQYNVAVAPRNRPPVANNDTYDVAQRPSGIPEAFPYINRSMPAPGMLGNDTDPDGNTLTAVNFGPLTPPGASALQRNADGSLTFRPQQDFAGTKTFTYRAQDTGGLMSNAATVTLNVIANRAPTPGADNPNVPVRSTTAYPPAGYSGCPQLSPQGVMLNVISNDTDPDTVLDANNRVARNLPNVLPVQIVSGPNAGGTAVVISASTSNPNRANICYRPAVGFTGVETLSYRVRDTRNAWSTPMTVRVNVQ